jgi:hypothetical protein
MALSIKLVMCLVVMVSFNTAYHEPRDEANSILCRWLSAGQNIYDVHDFGNIHSRYSNMRHDQHTSVTIGNRPLTWKVRCAFSLKSYIIFRYRFALVNFGCYFCLYEGKATYYTNIVSYILLFWRIRGRWLNVFAISFFKRQTWTQIVYLFNHSESIGCVRKCMCLSIFFMSL